MNGPFYNAAGVFGLLEKNPIDKSLNTQPGENWENVDFSASRSNSIYAASDTVMPESTDMPVGLYLGETT